MFREIAISKYILMIGNKYLFLLSLMTRKLNPHIIIYSFASMFIPLILWLNSKSLSRSSSYIQRKGRVLIIQS